MMSNVPNAESLLINGKGKTSESPDAPLSKFYVEYGKRYRFRLAYGGGSKSCSVTFSINQHTLKLVALDGHRIEPQQVKSIKLGRGERADFILETKRAPRVYPISVVADKSCQENLEGVGELVYETKESKVLHKDDDMVSEVEREFSSVTSDRCANEDVLCLGEVRALEPLPVSLAGPLHETIYVPFNYSTRQISAKRVGESIIIFLMLQLSERI